MSTIARYRPPFRWADIWEAPLHDFPIRDEVLAQYLPLSPTMDVLEVGPGSGMTAFRWARQTQSLTLLDVAPANIARLRAALKHLPNVRFLCADICKPELAASCPGQFNAAYAIEVFELLPDPDACLKNLAIMLRPGGCLLLQFPNYLPPRTPGITYVGTRAELDRMLHEAGFTSWSVSALRLRPFAEFLFDFLHERPLNLYRRWRARGSRDPVLVYDQSWAFHQQNRLEPYKHVLHTAWALLSSTMRLGGNCFTDTPLGNDIVNHNLLILATR